MAYCTSGDLVDALSSVSIAQLTDDVGGITINATYVSAAISKADAYINFYLRGKSILPLTTVPEPIGQISIDLSIRYLYERRSNLEAAGEGWETRWKRADKMLQDISNGKLLIDDSDSYVNKQEVYETSTATTDQVYNSAKLDEFF
jgi:phage gp36-like protein